MMRMWFGLEIDVVGLPPLGDVCLEKIFKLIKYIYSSWGLGNFDTNEL